MHAIGCLNRFVSRTFVNGVVVNRPDRSHETKLLTAVSGFPKSSTSTGIDIEYILKGQIGDDAYFITRHIDDWSREAGEEGGSVKTEDRLEDNSADVIGVADGVGGWRQYGVDPGQFSTHLMKSCQRLVSAGFVTSNSPAKLLAQSFKEMKESKKQIIGSSTACVMMLSHRDGRLYTANIGDSGFVVVRDGDIVHKSQEQQHYFNTPFQLSLPPIEMALDVLSDLPESADRYEFSVQTGDVILLATDGIFDNVPEVLLKEELASICGCSDRQKIQQCANSIALIARTLSRDEHFLSPFATNARASGFNISGGKEDDCTVLLATVVLPS